MIKNFSNVVKRERKKRIENFKCPLQFDDQKLHVELNRAFILINFPTVHYLSRFTLEMPIIIPRNVSPAANPSQSLLLLAINEHMVAPAAA